MHGSDQLTPKVAALRQISVGAGALFGLVLGLALTGTALAQGNETRITALFPTSTDCKQAGANNVWRKPDPPSPVLGIADAFPPDFIRKACSLEFSTESIPNDAAITGAVLRLVKMGDQPQPAHAIDLVAIPK